MKIKHVHDEYPRDGRVTLRPEMEKHAPTTTVGAYKAAMKRVADDDRALPRDFGDYLKARIPSTRHLSEIPNDCLIDPRGVLHGRA